MEEEGVTDPYDVESRVNGTVEDRVMNNVYNDRPRVTGRVKEGLIMTFTMPTGVQSL